MLNKVALRADGSAEIGLGHLIRSIALGSMLTSDFECCLYTRYKSDYIEAECRFVGIKVCYLSQSDNHFDEFLKYISGEEIVVLDNYFFDFEYQKSIKSIGCPLVCIDDKADKAYAADVVINHAPGLDPSIFTIAHYTKLCLGLSFAMLRQSFLNVKPSTKRQGVFICFGGSDFKNITTRLVKILKDNSRVDDISVVIGSGFQHEETLNELIENSKVKIFKELSAEEMKRMIASCEVAIVPASTILYEVIACNTPVISGYYVDNQVNIYEGFKKEKLISPYGDFVQLQDFTHLFNEVIDKVRSQDYELPAIKFYEIKNNYKRIFQNLTNDA